MLLRFTKKLREMSWKVFGKPDLPPKNFKVKPRINPYTLEEFKMRPDVMTQMYLDGDDLQTIAKHYGVTMERVRQCLWLVYQNNTK